MVKWIFRVASIGVLIFGIVIVLCSNSNDIIEKFESAPAITSSELSSYEGEEGSYVLITDIHLVGETFKDERDVLKGDFYVIKVDAEERGIGNEDESDKGWYGVEDKSYVLIDSNLKTDAFEEEKFSIDMVPLKLLKTSDEEEDGIDTYRYNYYAISKSDTLVALAKIVDGKPILRHLYEYDDFEGGSNYSYLIGDKETYDNYITYELGEGQNGSVIFVAIFVAIVLWVVSLFFSKKEKKKDSNNK